MEQTQTTEPVVGHATRHLVECRAWATACRMVKASRSRRAVFARLVQNLPRQRVAAGVKAKGHG